MLERFRDHPQIDSGYYLLANGLSAAVRRLPTGERHGYVRGASTDRVDPHIPDLLWSDGCVKPQISPWLRGWLPDNISDIDASRPGLGCEPCWYTPDESVADLSRPFPADTEYVMATTLRVNPGHVWKVIETFERSCYRYRVESPDGSETRVVTAGGLLGPHIQSGPAHQAVRWAPRPTQRDDCWVLGGPFETYPWCDITGRWEPVPPRAVSVFSRAELLCTSFGPRDDADLVSARQHALDLAVRNREYIGLRCGVVLAAGSASSLVSAPFWTEVSSLVPQAHVRSTAWAWFAKLPDVPDPADVLTFGVEQLMADEFATKHSAGGVVAVGRICGMHLPAQRAHLIARQSRLPDATLLPDWSVGELLAALRFAIDTASASPPWTISADQRYRIVVRAGTVQLAGGRNEPPVPLRPAEVDDLITYLEYSEGLRRPREVIGEPVRTRRVVLDAPRAREKPDTPV